MVNDYISLDLFQKDYLTLQRMKRAIYILLLLIPFVSFTQLNRDSLFEIWNDESLADTIRLNAVAPLAWELLFIHPDSAYYYSQLQYELARESDIKLQMAMALKVQGAFYYLQSDNKKALKFYNKSLKLLQEIGAENKISALLNNIGIIYQVEGDFLLALDYYFKSLKIDRKTNNNPGISSTYTNIGLVYYYQLDYDKAMDYFQRALKIYQLLPDMRREKTEVLNDIGMIHFARGDYYNAINYYSKCIKIHKEIGNNRGLAACLNNIGQIYAAQGEYDENQYKKALDYYQRSLKLKEKLPERHTMYSTLINMGNIYKNLKEYKKAKDLFERSLNISRDLDNEIGIASSLISIAKIYHFLNEYTEAKKYCSEGLNISENIRHKTNISLALTLTGMIYIEEKNFDKAIISLSRSLLLAQEIGDAISIRESSLYLYKAYKAIGQKHKALEMHELYYQMYDSIINKDNIKYLIQHEYQEKYQEKILKDSLHTLEKEKQIKFLEQQTEIDQLKQQQKENQLYFIIALLLTGIALGFLIYMINKKALKEKRNLQQQKILLQTVIQTEEKERKRISAELHDGIGQMLTAIKMNLENVKIKLDTNTKTSIPDELKDDFLNAHNSVDIICNEVRNISHRMLPKALEIAGIIPALEELLVNFLAETKIKYEFNHYGITEARFSDDIELAIYRIVQEMLNNIVKHAEANFITLQLLKNKNKLILIVEDNGKGFNFDTVINKHKGAGLSNINSRVQLINGKLNFQSGKGKGTIATIRIPIDEKN